LQWLSTLDYGAKQKDALIRRQPGTGEWFLNKQSFKDWEAQSFKTLFCHGIPGAGKTVMSAVVIEHLESIFKGDDSVGIAFIYCTYQGKKEEQKSTELVLSLVRQLVQPRTEVPADILMMYRELSRKGLQPTLEQSRAMLKIAIEALSKVYIVLDALDEYYITDRADYTTLLAQILGIQSDVQFSLLVTSRPIEEIIARFADAPSIEIHAQDADVTKYINNQLSRLLCPLDQHPGLQDEIRREVLRASDGMYDLTIVYDL
jgi:Cdc6-like AAA superfamily ATPase